MRAAQRLAISIVAFLLSCTVVRADHQELQLCRGVSLWLPMNSPEFDKNYKYEWPPFQGKRHFLANSELTKLHDVGFDFVRLTVNPGIFLQLRDRRPELFRLLHETVDRSVAAGLNVIVDIHPIQTNPLYPPSKIVKDPNDINFKAYRQLVQDFARELRGSSANNVALELMNEPAVFDGSDGVARWQLMIIDLYKTARRAAPELPIIVTGGEASSIEGLVALNPTELRDQHTFFTFHYYWPSIFTHQGVQGRNDTGDLVSVPFPPKPTLMPSAVQAAAKRIENNSTILPQDRTSRMHLAQQKLQEYFSVEASGKIEADFDRVSSWADHNNIASEKSCWENLVSQQRKTAKAAQIK